MSNIVNRSIVWIGTKLIMILCLLLLIGFVSLLLPYIYGGKYAYFYFSLKPYILQLFGSKESLWVFLAFFIIPLVELNKQSKSIHNKDSDMEKAKIGLKNELESNLLSIFAPNVDKLLNFYWFEKIDKELLGNLKGEGEKWKAFYDVYKEIYYYNDLVNVHFKQKSADVAEYQFDMQMKFADFVSWETHLEALVTDPAQDTPQHKKTGRDTLSHCFKDEKERCVSELNRLVVDLFD